MNSSSKAGSSSSKVSPDVAAEIARLMRDPNALRSERDGRQGPGRRGHYDPNQPRVPAGNPKGGEFAPKGYRGGESGRDHRVMQASLDGTQFAQLGHGNPRDAKVQPFDGMFGDIDPAQHLANQNGFIRAERDRRTNPRTRVNSFEAGAGGPKNEGRYIFIATEGMSTAQIDGGMRTVVSSTTYVYDQLTGAYATIRATPTLPIEILDINGKVFIRPFR